MIFIFFVSVQIKELIQEITECKNELRNLKSIVKKKQTFLHLFFVNQFYSLGFIRRSSDTTIIVK